MPSAPTERRPIASRDRAASRAVAAWLARRGVSPNALSLGGMGCGVAAGAAFWSTSAAPASQSVAWIAGAVLVQLRLAANMFDGMVAIATGRASPLGEILNEVPDRVSDAAILIGLGYAAGGHPTLGWSAAVAAVFTAYVRAEGRVAGAPQDYCGPFAKPQRMFVATLVALWCGLAPAGWSPTWSAAGLHGLPAWALALLVVGTLFTAARRLVRIGKALRR